MRFDSSRLPPRPLAFYRLVKGTIMMFIYDEAPMMGAALAYYALFSIAPLFMVAIAFAGMIFGSDAARGELEHHLTIYFGASVAASIQTLLTAAEQSRGGGTIAVTVGIALVLFGASSVFNQLKLSLNRIWKVQEPRHTGIKALLWNRGLAIIMVIFVGLLLMGSIILSAAVNALADFAAHEVLPFAPGTLWTMEMIAMFVLLSALFAVIFRYLPDIRIGWRSVLLGAVVTAVLFLAGRYLISLYLSRGGLASGYGAAGSVLVLLVWIYYSAQIFLFGAEFTHVYSRALHLPAEPIESEEEDQPAA